MAKEKTEEHDFEDEEEFMKDDNLFEEGGFAQTICNEELKDKMQTFHKKHDENMNFNCKKCGSKISAHNKDWHNGICDKCFDKEYFP